MNPITDRYKKEIVEAKFEAERFLRRIKELEQASKEKYWTMPKEHGAVRRASMDLTRALAELRRAL